MFPPTVDDMSGAILELFCPHEAPCKLSSEAVGCVCTAYHMLFSLTESAAPPKGACPYCMYSAMSDFAGNPSLDKPFLHLAGAAHQIRAIQVHEGGSSQRTARYSGEQEEVHGRWLRHTLTEARYSGLLVDTPGSLKTYNRSSFFNTCSQAGHGWRLRKQ